MLFGFREEAEQVPVVQPHCVSAPELSICSEQTELTPAQVQNEQPSSSENTSPTAVEGY